MKMDFNLDLRQTQKLVMTPQLQQAIKLLQLPMLELSQYLDQQYLENPMLEVVEEENVEVETEEEEFDIEWELYFQDRGDVGEPISKGRNTENPLEQLVQQGTTFSQTLSRQLSMFMLPLDLHKIAEYICNNLDDAGYLRQTCAEISATLGVNESEVVVALGIVQSLEPIGVGARDLRECLLLQLRQRRDVPTYTWRIVCRHLDLLAKGKIPILAERLNAKKTDVQTAIDYIRRLNPKPGLSMGDNNKSVYVSPDVTVLDVVGKWTILVNEGYASRLQVSPQYVKLLRTAENQETKKFLKGKFNAALWLLKAVEQRRSTLYRITEFIMEYQADFFKHGVKHLRPLRLRDVADDIDVHESTVSRAISGKYIQTPRGLFDFKYFFSVNLDTASGGGTSSTGVKKVIVDLIEEEDKYRPLTDYDLSQTLQQRGVKISRRTVAKYREELNIPNSNLRKRWA